MIVLSQLVQVVNKNKVAKVEVMGNPGNYQGKMRRLYDGISSGEFKSDKEAVKVLYGDTEDWTNYKKLKYRLEQRLINTAFFIDVNKASFDEAQKVYYSSFKNLAASKILRGRGGSKIALRIAERTLPKVLEHEYPEIAVGLLQDLAAHYSGRELNVKKFKRYNELLSHQLKALEAQAKAKEYDSWIKIKYLKRLASLEELHQEAIHYRKELRSYLRTVKTPRFLLPAFNVFMNEHLLINDHNKAIEICNEALKLFNDKPIPFKAGLDLYYKELINLYRQTKQYDKAEIAVQELVKLDFAVKGSDKFLFLFNLHLLICFYKQDYQKAYHIYNEATFGEDLTKNKKSYFEQFKLHEAFIHFFIAIGKIDPTKSEYPPLAKFRVSRFVNDVPDFAADKRKFNISLIIIQVLFLLQKRNYDAIIDKVEALRMYCHRYLRKDNTFRSNCFIKLLLVIPKSNFNRIAVERNAKKLWNQLLSVPLETANQAEDLEIVPYEFLWEMVLGMLDTPTKKIGKRV